MGGCGMNWFHRHVCGSGRWRRRIERDLLPWALSGVELGDNVLELGPGPGVTTDALRGRSLRLTVVDVDSELAASLERRLAGTGVRVVHGDATALPFADGSFSSVLSFTMLHHVPSPALQDRPLGRRRGGVARAPRGVFAGFDGVASWLFRLVHIRDTYVPVDPDTFGRRLEAAGFEAVAVERGRGRFRFRAGRK